ncbi:MAG: mechanosensitive ion channel family protein [Eubacterium sp.]|nr:mechanosensitive ion channel family protein [Eubacterium sp.]
MTGIVRAIDLSEIFNPKDKLGNLIEFLVYVLIAFVVTFILLKIKKKVVEKRLKKHKNIQVRFTQNLISGLIIAVAVIWVLVSSTATSGFGKVLFQGTAIIGAVIGLAAQPVIADLFSGLMISMNKPFQIGDRIELDNGFKGVVMDITPRHVVLRGIDTLDIIIPNSKINACVITNMSHNTRIRSVHFRFSVSYGTDVEKAMTVIREAVIASEYTIPARKGIPVNGQGEYGPVYFIAYADSSLQMATTVYYEPTVASEVVISDINLRVKKALDEAGIEIPFNYVNVVMKPENTADEALK